MWAPREWNVMRKVSDLLRQLSCRVSAETSIDRVARRFGGARSGPLAVVSPRGKYLGLIGLRDVLDLLTDKDLAKLVTAADLVEPDSEFLRADDSLETALERFARTEAEALAVVEDRPRPQVVGFVSRSDLLLACARKRTPATTVQKHGPTLPGRGVGVRALAGSAARATRGQHENRSRIPITYRAGAKENVRITALSAPRSRL